MSIEQWLTDATLHRLAATPAEASVRFECYLPYAMANDREEDWSSDFGSALGTAAAPDATRTTYNPPWYRRRQRRRRRGW